MKNQSLLENISSIYKRMSHAAMRAGRSPEHVKLIAVTKAAGIEQIREALDAGLRTFGENRIQEARTKIQGLSALSTTEYRLPAVEWHLIGHLQKNKAKHAVQLFDLIHSVDSVELAHEINRQAEKIGKIQGVLIEVKLSHEAAKHGVSRSGLTELLNTVRNLRNLHLSGLMTVPPFFDHPGEARPYFKELRELKDRAVSEGFDLPELSMGMSGDFEIAIEEGATMVRVGTAIFGQRK